MSNGPCNKGFFSHFKEIHKISSDLIHLYKSAVSHRAQTKPDSLPLTHFLIALA